MDMTRWHTYSLVFIFNTLCILSIFSCKGQIKEHSARGALVAALDHKIWDIYQDKKGQYWFGSNGQGVYRYNGEQLTRFTAEDGLAHHQIRGIQEDHKGILYFETTDGISAFDGTAFKTLEPVRAETNSWRLDPHDLWFGYDAFDLFRYDGTALYELKLPRQDLTGRIGPGLEGVPFAANNGSPYVVYGVDSDREGHMWFGTVQAGAFRYDGTSMLWIGEKELSTLPDGRVPGVRSMLQDQHGYFWLSHFNNRYRIDSTQQYGYEKIDGPALHPDIDRESFKYFNSGLVDQQGDLWMISYGGDLWHYDGAMLTHQELKNNDGPLLLICIYEDREGTLWLGTDNDGVYYQSNDEFIKFNPSH